MSNFKKTVSFVVAISALVVGSSVFADTAASPDMTPAQVQENKAEFSKLLDQAKNQQGQGSEDSSQSKPLPQLTEPKTVKKSNSSALSSAGSITKGSQYNEQAFASVAQNVMPLTPQQVTTLHSLLDKERRAAAAAPGTPPKPTSSSVIVNLSPGATPQPIRLESGFISSLVFLDASGAPWPIASYDLGDPKDYNIQETGDKKTGSSVLMVQALTQYKPTNLVINLKGMTAPVTLTLLPGQNAVDYRVDLRVPQLGPNAEAGVSGLPSVGGSAVLNVLDGIPPAGAKELTITGGDAKAWKVGAKMYLRTRLTLLSPGWVSKMNSPDGTNAYELEKAPVLLASDHGKMVQLQVGGLQ